ncbi:MAG: DNA translocase FtsK 4TM domain-containing protein [Thermoguttaceae bacterium]
MASRLRVAAPAGKTQSVAPRDLMLEHRNLKMDLLALGLLAAVVFLAASLLSYDPADPPSKLVFPERAEVLNACGRSGALVSRLLFTALGLGAYYLLVSLAALDAVLLARRPVGQPLLRLTGWLLSLVGFTTLMALAAPQLSPGPVIGSGGYLGAAGRGLLEMNFAAVGAYIFTVSLILGGLLLSTDYLLVHIFAWVIGKPTKNLGRGMLHVGAAYAQKINRRRSDLDVYEEDAAQDAVAVRISGRPAAEDKEEDEDDEEEEESQAGEEKEADSEPADAGAASRKPPASLLRIAAPRKTPPEEVLKDLQSEGDAGDYELPGTDLLLAGEPFCFEEQEKEVRRKAKILEKTFLDFGFHVRVVEIQTGPVIAQYEVELEAGLRLSKITGLSDDLAVALRVPSVRIVAPLPGKNTVGVEVPNSERQIVRLREVMEETDGKAQAMRIPIFLGKDVSGNPMVVDLTTLPHLLIAGRTGTGKSVCLNSIIVSMLMTRRPDEVRLLLIDPKMVELSPYKCLPHLMHPVVTDMRKAEAILAWAVEKMEERYHLLARAGVRHISVYNQLGEEELMERIKPEDDDQRRQIPTHMPYVVIVADELADLMMTAAKEVEQHIIRLAQKSRAVGIHLVLATQKPTVDVITGLIKSNLPARISFQVASRTDSRVVLDEMGADKLLGNGDLLFLWPGTSTLIRGQGTYLCDDEINRVIAAVATSEPQFVRELVQLKLGQTSGDGKQALGSRDELYEAAIDVVVREGRGSVSLLQRALGIGYGRAARLIDYMAEDGIVGPYNGSQAREILLTLEQWQDMNGQAPAAGAAAPPPPRHNNRILMAPPEDKEEQAPAAAPPTAAATRPADTDDAPLDEEDDEFEEDGEEDLDEEEDDEEDEEDDDLEEEDEEEDEGDEDDEEAEAEDVEEDTAHRKAKDRRGCA